MDSPELHKEEKEKVMAKGGYDYSDEETLALVKEYERYIREHPDVLEDFDEWLEITYSHNKSRGKKVLKKQTRYFGNE